MIATTESRVDTHSSDAALPSVVRTLVLLLLAGVLIWAHGCHGDEDTELFTRLAQIVGGR